MPARYISPGFLKVSSGLPRDNSEASCAVTGRLFVIINKTKIKNNVFIGSNSSLVAPLTVEENSTIGAGSVITKNVKKKSLALSRNLQTEIKNYKRK